MPLIIKSLNVDPPNYDELSDDEDDFVKDPAQYRDELPQPFRLIDSLLSQFLDEVWDEITSRESERVADQSKIRPPKYECSVQLQENSNAKVLSSSADGRYVFVGCPGSISILHAANKEIIYTYEDERLDLYALHCTIINAETYVLTAIDELGLCYMFGVTAEKIFPIKIINEDAGNTKYHASKFRISPDGDYLGVVLENVIAKDVVLEVYQLPRDMWIKELDDVKNKLIQEEAKNIVTSSSSPPSPTERHLSSAVELEVEAVSTEDVEPMPADDLENQMKKSTESPRKKKRVSTSQNKQGQCKSGSKIKSSIKQSGRQEGVTPRRSGLKFSQNKCSALSRSGRSSHRKKAGSKKELTYKFTLPTAVMRQHSPAKLSPNANAQTYHGDPKVMGSGQGHLLTRTFIEIRNESFNDKHRDLLVYETPPTDYENQVECEFHFFSPGMVIPYGLELPGALRKPSSIGVWWSGSRQFTFYCLTKPIKAKKSTTDGFDSVIRSKRAVPSTSHSVQQSRTLKAPPTSIDTTHVQPGPDLEIKPDAIWPQAAPISASATSDDSALVAIGLENGLVTIWDQYLGIMRKSVNIGNSAIGELTFLNPSICPQGNNYQQCYPTSTSCYVLVRCKDSSLRLINTGMMDHGASITVSDKSSQDDDVITAVEIFPKIPEILSVTMESSVAVFCGQPLQIAEILRVHKNGAIYLQDVITGKVLCEVSLPSTHSLTSPWSPIISFGAFGQMLYIKGTQKNDDEPYVENVQESLFVFQLRSFPTLDAYWMRKRLDIGFITPCSMDTRVNAILSQRVKASGARQQRLQQRWPLMKQELLRVIQIKSH